MYTWLYYVHVWIENFMTNQEILTCWWVLDHFGSQNVQRRWVPPWSIDVIVTLRVHIQSSRLTHVIKYCKRTLHCICCYQFSFVFFYLLFLSFFLLYFFFKFRTRYFLAFSYTTVSTLSQLKKKKKKKKTTSHWHILCAVKNYFSRC